jgi:hypothetical protein
MHNAFRGWLFEIEMPSRRQAGVIAGQTGFADVGPHGVDRARRRNADLTDKGRTAIAMASHAALCVIDIGGGNPIEIGVSFQREARPLR